MTAKTSSGKKVMGKVQGTPVPINWNVPDNIITRFASNMVVQILESEFKISFFEVAPDIKLALEGRTPDEVQANCIASIIVSADKLPSFINLLQNQYGIYNQIKSKAALPNASTEP